MKKLVITSRVLLGVAFGLFIAWIVFCLFFEAAQGPAYYKGLSNTWPGVYYSANGVAQGWLPIPGGDGWAKISIFYRYAYSLHTFLIYFLSLFFNQNTLNKINQAGSANYYYYCGVITALLVIMFVLTYLPLCFRTMYKWKISGLVFGAISFVFLAGFAAWNLIFTFLAKSFLGGGYLPELSYISICLCVIILAGLLVYLVYMVLYPHIGIYESSKGGKLSSKTISQIKDPAIRDKLNQTAQTVQTEQP